MEGRTLAKRPGRGRAEVSVATEQVLLFRIGDGIYGVGIHGLWEVLSSEGVTGLPTPAYQVCSALAYRGRTLPLVRLSELFGVSTDRVSPTARVLLTQAHGRALGLLVDEVFGVVEIEPRRIARMPAQATLLNPDMFRGLCSRGAEVVILINVDGLGSIPEVAQFAAE